MCFSSVYKCLQNTQDGQKTVCEPLQMLNLCLRIQTHLWCRRLPLWCVEWCSLAPLGGWPWQHSWNTGTFPAKCLWWLLDHVSWRHLRNEALLECRELRRPHLFTLLPACSTVWLNLSTASVPIMIQLCLCQESLAPLPPCIAHCTIHITHTLHPSLASYCMCH